MLGLLHKCPVCLYVCLLLVCNLCSGGAQPLLIDQMLCRLHTGIQVMPTVLHQSTNQGPCGACTTESVYNAKRHRQCMHQTVSSALLDLHQRGRGASSNLQIISVFISSGLMGCTREPVVHAPERPWCMHQRCPDLEILMLFFEDWRCPWCILHGASVACFKGHLLYAPSSICVIVSFKILSAHWICIILSLD